MEKITVKNLDQIVDAINRDQHTPLKTWTRVDGKLIPNARNYHLDSAYGGYALYQHGISGSGARDVFQLGHMPKRQLHDLLRAYQAGLKDGWDYNRCDRWRVAPRKEQLNPQKYEQVSNR